MIDTAQAIWLALLQGLTEFLPISSSAHLILVPRILGWPDQGLVFDIAVHVGTLLAVIIYFRKELMQMMRSWGNSVAGRGMDDEARLAWGIILGTIPVIIGGLLFADDVETTLRSPMVIAIATIGFGVLLGVADRNAADSRTEYSLSWGEVLFIGVSQAVALIPGTSRSGITMTAGLFIGMTREAAARFSFLLSIPTIMMGGLHEGLKIFDGSVRFDAGILLVGIAVSAVSALFVIHFFLKFISKMSMMPFVVYRLLLGAVLLVLFY